MIRTDQGILIAVEGIDGAGKTTQVDKLEHFFRQAGEQIVRSKEPTDGKWGRLIRASAISGRLSLQEELHAFVEDRKEHVANLILPALKRRSIVLLDRYFYSTIAYQGCRGLSVLALTAQMLEIAPVPDAVILLDVSPAVSQTRIRHGRGEKPNEFESVEYLKCVRDVFLDLAKTHSNVIKVDGELDIEATFSSIVGALFKGPLKKQRSASLHEQVERVLAARPRA